MEKNNYLPDGKVLEATKMVPPESVRNGVWQRAWKKLRSTFIRNRIEEYEKKGGNLIILVGCDIKNINAFLNTSDNVNRRY